MDSHTALNAPAWLIGCLFLVSLFSCRPDETLQLRQIKNVKVELAQEPIIRADAIIHNPNRMGGKLRKADIVVKVDGKPAATLQQNFNQRIPAQSDFTLPLEVRISLQDIGLLNTVLSVLGGKKIDIEYTGNIWITYNGVRIKLPVQHREEVRVRM